MEFGAFKETELGDVKHKTFFAWLPVTIHGQTRWLETITVKYMIGFNGFGNYSWFKEAFVNTSILRKEGMSDLDYIRLLVSHKINRKRDIMKDKLQELGSYKISELDPSKYSEYIDFLEKL